MAMALSRRKFLIAASTALAGSTSSALRALEPKIKNAICVFSKPLQSLSYHELAEHVADLNVAGIEAPIRDGGHIEPAQVEQELPKFVEALRKRDLEVTVMTSSINDPNDPRTEKILRTAAGLGIRRYRMKYFQYDLDRPIYKQIDAWRGSFRDLAAMNKEIGISAVYQNHAGLKYLGAAIWDLAKILDGIAVDEIGVAYDIRHATVEGGMSWPVTFSMIRPHINTVYVKDFQWVDGKPKNVPLGEGQVSADFFRMLAQSNYSGPISLHEEYLDHRDPSLVPKHLAAIKNDLAVLRKLLAM